METIKLSKKNRTLLKDAVLDLSLQKAQQAKMCTS